MTRSRSRSLAVILLCAGMAVCGPVDGPGRARAQAPDVVIERGTLSTGDETLDSGEYADVYDFTGTRGEEVVVDLRSDDFDPYLVVVDPHGEQHENDDHEGNSSRSLLRLTLPADGRYAVLVTSYSANETGAYDLTIRTAAGGGSDPDVRVERGTLAAGDETLSTGEYLDAYSFEGSPGTRVVVDLTSNAFDSYLMLVGPGDFQRENDDAGGGVGHSRIEADLTQAGTYQAIVTSYEAGETGDYVLGIERGGVSGGGVSGGAQDDVQSLRPGRPATGTLDDGDSVLDDGEFVDVWSFDARAGDALTVELASDDFDTYLILVSPDGENVGENDDADGRTDRSRITTAAPATGSYQVAVTAYSAGETGRYTVSATTGAATVRDAAPSRRAAPAAAGGVYGVFVGISDYPGDDNDLDYTADDARRARDAIVRGGGMDPDNAIVLTDRDATVANVQAAFRDMGRRVGPDDTFIYFYSGHGDRVRRTSPERSDPDALDETIELYDAAIRDNAMSDLLGLVDARISLVVLDSCFSGGFSKDAISAPGRMGFFSSEEDVTSQVAAKFEAGGYLSRFLIDGVGDRRADRDRDGAISAIELSDYIHERYRSDVDADGSNDYVRRDGPAVGFQRFVADRGSIDPDDVVFR